MKRYRLQWLILLIIILPVFVYAGGPPEEQGKASSPDGPVTAEEAVLLQRLKTLLLKFPGRRKWRNHRGKEIADPFES